jgi:hypothetical protein
MDAYRLRAIILKLQDRLSNDDRKRLHFYLGHDVPRRIRDDPSLGGTLSLMESLFDRDKINEKDFTFLINAFDEIQCLDAVKLLKGELRFLLFIEWCLIVFFDDLESLRTNQPIDSISMLMPLATNLILQDEDEDKVAQKHRR